MSYVRRFALSFTVVLAVGLIAHAADESLEPPTKFRLEVGGKSYPIVEGEPLKLPGTLINPTVKLIAEPYREFNYGVTFLYPRSFMFEADVKADNYKTWTVSGNNFTVMYFVVAGNLTTDEFADSLDEQYGKGTSKRSHFKSDLLGQKNAGTRLDVVLAGQQLTVDIHSVSVGERSKFLVLQDSPGESGQPSKESKETLALLKRSLSIK